jgi:hypothetical protein
VAFSVLSMFNAAELAGGGPLARGICGYIAGWWMRLGYRMLTVVFPGLATVYSVASLL